VLISRDSAFSLAILEAKESENTLPLPEGQDIMGSRASFHYRRTRAEPLGEGNAGYSLKKKKMNYVILRMRSVSQ
jgi:hypothetical protein